MAKETKTEAPKSAPTSKDIEENKTITFLSYLGILALIPLLVKQDSPFAQFHAKQGIVLFVCWFILSWIAGFIPLIGWFLLAPAVSIVGIVLAIMGLMNVAKGETKALPVIDDIVKKVGI